MKIPNYLFYLATTLSLWGLGGLLGCSESSVPATSKVDSAVTIEKQFQQQLDDLYRAAQSTDENFPGATAAFILPDGRIFSFATGFSDVSRNIPMGKNMRMPSGSIGKTYAAAVALQLAQNGALDLDTKISTWLGEEAWFSRVPNNDELTVRILLTHTGGLLDHAFASREFVEWVQTSWTSGNRDAYLRPRQLVEFVLDREPLFAVGEGFNYTDTGYILVGIALEEATGRSYYDLLRELFLQPLDFAFTLPADQRALPDLAQGYAHESSKFFGTPLEIVEDGIMVMNPLTEWTGGGLINNPQDLVRWAKLLYEGEAISGEGELDQLLQIGFMPEPDKPTDGYGLGVSIRQTEHGISYGHGGFYPGYNSRMVYFPDHGVAVAMQINSDKSNVAEHTMTLAGTVLQGLLATRQSG